MGVVLKGASRIPVLAVALLFVSCGGNAPPDAADLPNVLLLTVDTLRADHLRSYGYARNTMPAIEEFAKTATVFDNAVVPRGSTRPSYASMLTGQYPFRHGVRTNNIQLHGEVATLQETLKKAGYHTAGFVSNFVLVGGLSGMEQGFDVYDDRLDEREGVRENFERTAVHTLKAVLEWLETDPPQPFFLFVNLIDPHGPYAPPDEYRELFRTDKEALVDEDKIPPYQKTENTRNYFDFIDRYDAEIRYTDDALALLIQDLRERGLWDESLVVFTADHGESLGEHDIFFDHNAFLWEETTRVPLMIRLPGGAGRGPARRTGVCSPMDLPPTILDVLGLPTEAVPDGESLLPVLRGDEARKGNVFIEYPNAAEPNIDQPDMFALRSDTHKLVRVADQNTGRVLLDAVSDLRDDPLELNPRDFDPDQESHRALARELDRVMSEMRSYELPFIVTEYVMPYHDREGFVAGRRDNTRKKTLTDEQIERLRSLGYAN